MTNDQTIKEVICIYPGRFQPMGLHHKQIYKSLQEKYGENNVFVTTTNEVQLPKSPLNIQEKKLIMSMHDIPRNNICEVSDLFSINEVLKGKNLQETAVVFAVGKKTLKEKKKWFKENKSKFKKLPKKDGKPKYKCAEEVSYIHELSDVKNKLQETGTSIASGSDIREALASGDEKSFRGVMGFHNSMIRELLAKKFAEAKSFMRVENDKKIKENLTFNLIKDIINESIIQGKDKFWLLKEHINEEKE